MITKKSLPMQYPEISQGTKLGPTLLATMEIMFIHGIILYNLFALGNLYLILASRLLLSSGFLWVWTSYGSRGGGMEQACERKKERGERATLLSYPFPCSLVQNRKPGTHNVTCKSDACGDDLISS